MKKIALSILLITSTLFLFSQESNIIYYEDFNDKSNGWETFNNITEFAHISDGKYVIKSSMTQSLRWYGMQIFIDYRKNFRIEAKMRQTDGYKNQGYGIVWGSKGWEDSFEFIVTSSGFYSIGGYDNEEYFQIKGWTKSSKINRMSRYNILAIEKDGINLNFYINNEQVHTCRFKVFYGQVHGFILRQNVTAEVDYLKITTAPRKIDIASGILSDKKKENLGLNVNSPYSEIAPIISADGKTLYVGRIYHPTNYGKKKECDIWYSTLRSPLYFHLLFESLILLAPH